MDDPLIRAMRCCTRESPCAHGSRLDTQFFKYSDALQFLKYPLCFGMSPVASRLILQVTSMKNATGSETVLSQDSHLSLSSACSANGCHLLQPRPRRSKCRSPDHIVQHLYRYRHRFGGGSVCSTIPHTNTKTMFILVSPASVVTDGKQSRQHWLDDLSRTTTAEQTLECPFSPVCPPYPPHLPTSSCDEQ